MKLTGASQNNGWSEVIVRDNQDHPVMLILFSGGSAVAFAVISQAVAYIDDQLFKNDATVRKHILRWGGGRARTAKGTMQFNDLLVAELVQRLSFGKEEK